MEGGNIKKKGDNPKGQGHSKTKKEKTKEQNLVKARTAVMNGYVKTFVELYPDKEPDEIKLTVKVID